MWIRFSILMLVTLLNTLLGFFVLKKTKANIAKIYFSLICFASAMWSGGWAIASLIREEYIFLIITRIFYIAATAIFLFFFLFSVQFLYKYKVNKILKYIITISSVYMFYIIISGKLFLGTCKFNGFMYQAENSLLLLAYGVYFMLILFISYYVLFTKYFKSQGVNRKILLWLISGTLMAFIFGIFFAWYMPYINKQHLNWIGPIASIFMNFSIFYLFFKKEEE